VKRTSQWFKMCPQDWLDGTRDLKPVVRAIYFDCLCLIYQFEGPLRDEPQWIAHQLHVPVQTWVAARKTLLAAGKLKETPDGLTNDRAEIELTARAKQCEVNRRIAQEREADRHRQSGTSAADRELRQTSRRAEGKLSASCERGNSESTNKNNGGGARSVQRRDYHAHARENKNHHHLKTEIEEKEREVESNPPLVPVKGGEREVQISQFGLIDDDDRGHAGFPKRQPRPLSRSMLKELELKVGSERAEELQTEYLGSDYARNAKVIDAAFRGWLKKTYGIEISGRGTTMSVGELVAICGLDKRGRPNTTLPSASELTERTARVESAKRQRG